LRSLEISLLNARVAAFGLALMPFQSLPGDLVIHKKFSFFKLKSIVIDVKTLSLSMRIEEELKSNKFRSEKHKAILSILFTSSWLSGEIGKRLKSYGISHEQFNIMRIVRGSMPDGLSAVNIRSRMIDRMSNVSRLIDKLYTKGLVERVSADTDRRKVIVTLTPKGSDLLSKIDDETVFSANWPEQITPEDASMLVHILDKMRG
jgi:DNA-binding MarR family transcriptional regulator